MYTVGSKLKNYYPVWNLKGDLIAECLNITDADSIANAMNKQIPKNLYQIMIKLMIGMNVESVVILYLN